MNVYCIDCYTKENNLIKKVLGEDFKNYKFINVKEFPLEVADLQDSFVISANGGGLTNYAANEAKFSINLSETHNCYYDEWFGGWEKESGLRNEEFFFKAFTIAVVRFNLTNTEFMERIVHNIEDLYSCNKNPTTYTTWEKVLKDEKYKVRTGKERAPFEIFFDYIMEK